MKVVIPIRELNKIWDHDIDMDDVLLEPPKAYDLWSNYLRQVSGTPKKADAPTKARRKEYLGSLKTLNIQVANDFQFTY